MFAFFLATCKRQNVQRWQEYFGFSEKSLYNSSVSAAVLDLWWQQQSSALIEILSSPRLKTLLQNLPVEGGGKKEKMGLEVNIHNPPSYNNTRTLSLFLFLSFPVHPLSAFFDHVRRRHARRRTNVRVGAVDSGCMLVRTHVDIDNFCVDSKKRKKDSQSFKKKIK